MPALVTWRPFHEPLRVTLVRTGLVGLAVGCVAAIVQGQLAALPQWTAFALWFSFGGHWVELFFLNWLRPRLSSGRSTQVLARVFTWIAGGTLLMVCARITVLSFGTHAMRLPPWWLGGPIFLCVELLVHAPLQFREQPNFYNGLR
jgi:hypothetical protein